MKKLKEKDLENAVRGLGVNDAWKKFIEVMREIIEENKPKHKRANKKRPWVTREVQKRRRAKNKAWKNFQNIQKEARSERHCESVARLEKLKTKYVNKRNICNIANRKAFRDFEQTLSRNVK